MEVRLNTKLSQQLDANFYNVTNTVAELSGATLEAPGIVKRNGVYYLFASHTSGWAPNPNKVFTASVSLFKCCLAYHNSMKHHITPGDLGALVSSARYRAGIDKHLLLAECIRSSARQ